MKSYNKQLREFIEYVLTKYKNNERVQEFGKVYENHKQEKLAKKEQRKVQGLTAKRVTIEEPTADLCKKLISAEIEKDKLLHMYGVAYNLLLECAKNDLDGKGYALNSQLKENE